MFSAGLARGATVKYGFNDTGKSADSLTSLQRFPRADFPFHICQIGKLFLVGP